MSQEISQSLQVQFQLRPANPNDVPEIFRLIQSLADYEQLLHQVTGTPELLSQHLFSSQPHIEVIVAESDTNLVGFALFFHNYSTFLTQPGIYLEDLFVQPDFRGCGIGKALIIRVAQIAVERGCGRFEWSVLDWNQTAIDFYKYMGADVLEDWRICRVAGESLLQLSQQF
ncbi:MAG: GNAT family N-acetyltransferase [Microcoleaceae cyanobacterium]